MIEEIGTVPHLAAGKPAGHDDLLIRRRHRLVEAHLPAGKGICLDFGCGTGAQTFHFVEHFERVIGLDINPQFLDAVREHAAETGVADRIEPTQYTGAEIPLDDDSVDYVISFAVLEHVEDEALALREIARVLRPGGTLIMSVPNRWWIFETHGADLPLLPWNRVPFVSWWPTRLHDRYARARIYEKRQIVEKIAERGFDIVESFYLTAPMDVLKWKPLQSLLRKTIFRGDRTGNTFLSPESIVVARRL